MGFKQYLIEDAKYRLFVDMDGVLCDWEAQVYNFSGIRVHGTVPDREKYKIFAIESLSLEESFRFWADMPWTRTGQAFWESVQHLNPIILSSADEADRRSVEGKYAWCERHLSLPRNRIMIVRNSADKIAFAKPGRVLVDDFYRNVHDWENGGGIGVLFRDGHEAVSKVKQVLAPTYEI